MKLSIPATSLLLAAIFAASPAVAKTSLIKGQQVCVSTAKAQDPAPKAVRADAKKTLSNDATITVTLKVKNADDSSSLVKCTIDRETSVATLTPAS
jgi:hypothetical protein